MTPDSKRAPLDVAELSRRLEMAQLIERALGEVIQIIARSAGDLDMAMEAILQGALSICEAQLGIPYRYEPETGFRAEHMKRVPEAVVDFLIEQGSFRVDPGTGLGRVERRHEIVKISDVRSEDVYAQREPLRVATVGRKRVLRRTAAETVHTNRWDVTDRSGLSQPAICSGDPSPGKRSTGSFSDPAQHRKVVADMIAQRVQTLDP